GGCMPIAGVPARSDSAAGATGAGSDVVALVQGAVRRPELVRRALGRVVVQGDRSPVDAVRCRPGLWMAVEGIGARGEEHGTVVQGLDAHTAFAGGGVPQLQFAVVLRLP